MIERRIAPSGDPFYAAGLDRRREPEPEPDLESAHGCYDGWVFLGLVAEDGELEEIYDRVPCRKCRA